MKRPSKPSHEDILWLEDYLPYRLAVVAARMLRDASRVYKRRRNPLTTPQWRTVGILANHEPLTATELVRISMLDKVAISRALAQLQRRGFIARHKLDGDRRARKVTLTAAGWRYYNELVPEMKRQEQTLRAQFKGGELEQLFVLLDRFDAFFAAKEGA
ncbi:MAG TPA: MarR family transcriptional regulator [Burkholderiales bacterium]|nr:MarR family transcriptional regulator [Burkholderiales bacterium]